MKILRKAFQTKEIRNRFIFTFLMAIIIRAGSQLPVPGIDEDYFTSWFASVSGDSFSLLNAFTGGSFLNMSVFALSITPYITASIIIQLLTIAFPKLEEIQKDGEKGRKLIQRITRYLTIGLAVTESLAMAIGFGKQGLLEEYNVLNVILMTTALTAGSAILVWIGDRITENGIGNGISIVLLINIVSQIPQDIYALFAQFVLGKDIPYAILNAFVIVLIIAAITAFTILLNEAERILPIQDSKTGRRLPGNAMSQLPIKANPSGVIPVIFASSILQFPILISTIAGYNGTGIWNEVLMYLSSSYWFSSAYPKYTLGLLIYIVLIVFFVYFYTQITFNPLEIADNLKKRGAFIPGIRPGKPTAEYLTDVLNHLVFIGAAGLVILSVIPYVFNGLFNASVSFGGTSLIIIVSVILETKRQVEGMCQSRTYSTFI